MLASACVCVCVCVKGSDLKNTNHAKVCLPGSHSS